MSGTGAMHPVQNPLIDGLQYANWSEKVFRQMREGGVDAVHVTITYHENFRETVLNIEKWNRWFETYPDLIFQGMERFFRSFFHHQIRMPIANSKASSFSTPRYLFVELRQVFPQAPSPRITNFLRMAAMI